MRLFRASRLAVFSPEQPVGFCLPGMGAFL